MLQFVQISRLFSLTGRWQVVCCTDQTWQAEQGRNERSSKPVTVQHCSSISNHQNMFKTLCNSLIRSIQYFNLSPCIPHNLPVLAAENKKQRLQLKIRMRALCRHLIVTRQFIPHNPHRKLIY